jgi:hypothetical protein
VLICRYYSVAVCIVSRELTSYRLSISNRPNQVWAEKVIEMVEARIF